MVSTGDVHGHDDGKHQLSMDRLTDNETDENDENNKDEEREPVQEVERDIDNEL